MPSVLPRGTRKVPRSVPRRTGVLADVTRPAGLRRRACGEGAEDEEGLNMRLIKAGTWAAAAFVAAVMSVAVGTSPAKASVERAFRGHTAGTIAFTSATTATVTEIGRAHV